MVGQTVGHYRIEEKLGEGGMGAVYRAEDTRLGRAVALKILPPERVADPQRLSRFLQEARLASSLNHPHIATILDVGEADGRHYIAMEFVEGETLRRRLGRQSLQMPLLFDLATQIADALTEAHGRGIVHRDLKSDNIMVTPRSSAKILDFGLGKRLAEEGPADEAAQTLAGVKTEAGLIMGTVNYMSPEQALGQPVDARSDLFSFGVVLYEMCTGRAPFESGTATSTIDKILHQAPTPPARLNDELPAAMEQAVLKLLEKNPEDRYQSAREVLVDLRRLKRASDTGTLSAARLELPARRILSRKQKLLLAAIAAGFGLVMFLLGRQTGSRPAESMMRFSAVTNFAGVEAYPALSPDGRSVAFVSDREGQWDIWVGLVTGGSLIRITSDPHLESRPRWSPDGAKIAYARLNEAGLWDIWVVPALGGTSRKIVSNGGDPAWSPDGRSLAYVNGATRTIWISDATGGNARALAEEEPMVRHRQPAFSRDGRQLAFVRAPSGPYGELAVIEVATKKLRYLTDDGALVLSPVWSPDDQFIYFASSRGGTTNIWKIAVRSGALEQITAGQGDDAELDLSNDGKRMVFSSYRININLAEVGLDSTNEPARPKWLTTDSARGELAPAYSPDGRRMAYFSNRKGTEKEGIWVMDADGSNPTQLVDDDRQNIFPRWAPDGQSLIYISSTSGPGASRLWSSREIRRVSLTGNMPQKLPLIAADLWPDMGPGGDVLFRSPSGSVQLFDPRTNRTQTVPAIKGITYRWSRSGRRAAYLVPPREVNDTEAGLWVYDFQNAPRQVFRGWVVWLAWAGPEELLALEGKPNLKGSLWRVRLDGSRSANSAASFPLIYSYWHLFPISRFDVHPDRRRIAVEALELNEADIGMIENIR